MAKIPFPLRERGHFQSMPSEGAWVASWLIPEKCFTLVEWKGILRRFAHLTPNS